MNAMFGGLSQDKTLMDQQGPELVLARPHAPVRPVDSELCRIALVGFGTVGTSVARLLQVRQGEAPLQVSHVCSRNIARKKAQWMRSDIVWTESMEEVLDSRADVIVELMGGLEPAHLLLSRALRAGKSVVTANKQLIAHFGSELLQLASDHGQYLGYGACVAGGIPVLSGLQNGLAGDRLVQIRGILNGTCNFILTRMEHVGSPLADALGEAQQAGYAEADPTFDIDGQDAGAKLAILARAGLKIGVMPGQVLCRTIRAVAAIDFDYAHELHCTIRQISTARVTARSASLSVEPSLVDLDSPLAKVAGSQNLIVSTGEFGGDTTFGGYGAGGDPTAVAVVSDIMEALSYRASRVALPAYRPASGCDLADDLDAARYVRFVVQDRPGIIAALASVFANHQMNLNAILQKPGHSKSALPFVVTLEPCPQSKLDAALDEISGFDFLVEAPLSMPILQ
jgi:homoserine dehydrogenase